MSRVRDRAIVALVQGYMDYFGATTPMNTIFGLPTHPLVVHAAVVLIPLAAIGAIAVALVPRWSRRYGALVWFGTILGTASCLLAAASGEDLAARVGTPAAHALLGEQMKYLGMALFVVTFVLWLLDHRADDVRQVSVKILAGVVIALAVMALVWTVRTGDTGARAVWEPLLNGKPPGR